MAITYIKAVSATLVNNTNIVTVTGEFVDFSKAADYLVALDNGLYVLPVLSGTAPDGSGNSTLVLAETWTGATLSNKSLLIFPTFAKIYESVAAMTALNDVTRGILTKLKSVLTDTSPTLDIIVGQTSSIKTVPYGYLANQVTGLIGQLNSLVGSVQAMTKSAFDSARSSELSKFPVAGFENVDYKKGFEFQQVNGWQDRFKINTGKVRIDGVLHGFDTTTITLAKSPNGLQNKDLTSPDFTNLAAAIVAGGSDLSQSYLNQQQIVYCVQRDIEAPNALPTNYIQDANNKIYADNGVLRQRTLSFESAKLAESINIETGKVWSNTVKCMQSLGWVQSSIFGQWNKGGDIAVAICVVSSLNKGACHPRYNSTGCAAMAWATDISGQVLWHNANVHTQPENRADCFGVSKTKNLLSGSISANYKARPDGKFFDAIYASDVKDLRQSLRKLPLAEIREKYKRMAIAGEVRGFEGVPFTKSYTQAHPSYTGTNFNISIGDAALCKVGDSLDVLHNAIWKKGEIISITSSTEVGISSKKWGADFGRTQDNTAPTVVIAHKQKHSSANPAWTDIISDSANIFPVEGQWIQSVPDGNKDTFASTRKASQIYSAERSTDGGVTWASFTPTLNATINEITLTNEPVGNIVLVHYETQAHFTQEDTLGEALARDTFVFATNNHNDALLTSSLKGIIAVGTDNNEQLGITKINDGVVSHTPETNAVDLLVNVQLVNKNGVAVVQFNIDDSGVIDSTKCQSFETQYFVGDE